MLSAPNDRHLKEKDSMKIFSVKKKRNLHFLLTFTINRCKLEETNDGEIKHDMR